MMKQQFSRRIGARLCTIAVSLACGATFACTAAESTVSGEALAFSTADLPPVPVSRNDPRRVSLTYNPFNCANVGYQNPNPGTTTPADLAGDGNPFRVCYRPANALEASVGRPGDAPQRYDAAVGMYRVGAEAPIPGFDWQLAQAADVDGDGKDDLVWRNLENYAVAIWLMDGFKLRERDFAYLDAGQAPGDAWSILTHADYNQDGKEDLVWSRSDDGVKAIWLMNGFEVLERRFITDEELASFTR